MILPTAVSQISWYIVSSITNPLVLLGNCDILPDGFYLSESDTVPCLTIKDNERRVCRIWRRIFIILLTRFITWSEQQQEEAHQMETGPGSPQVVLSSQWTQSNRVFGFKRRLEYATWQDFSTTGLKLAADILIVNSNTALKTGSFIFHTMRDKRLQRNASWHLNTDCSSVLSGAFQQTL